VSPALDRPEELGEDLTADNAQTLADYVVGRCTLLSATAHDAEARRWLLDPGVQQKLIEAAIGYLGVVSSSSGIGTPREARGRSF
jgi:hypothetical protein